MLQFERVQKHFSWSLIVLTVSEHFQITRTFLIHKKKKDFGREWKDRQMAIMSLTWWQLDEWELWGGHIGAVAIG